MSSADAPYDINAEAGPSYLSPPEATISAALLAAEALRSEEEAVAVLSTHLALENISVAEESSGRGARRMNLNGMNQEEKLARKREFARLRQARYKERKEPDRQRGQRKKDLKVMSSEEKKLWQREQRRMRQASLRERNKDDENWKRKRRVWDSARRDRDRKHRVGGRGERDDREEGDVEAMMTEGDRLAESDRLKLEWS